MKTLKRAFSALKARGADIAARAGHTFWQSFTAVVGVTWAASGLDVTQVTDVGAAKRFALAALGAVAAAALSAAKSTLAAMSADPGEYVSEHAASPPA